MIFGRIIAISHGRFPPKCSWGRENPRLVWNFIMCPDDINPLVFLSGDSWCLIQNLPSTKREFLRLIDGLLIFFWGWIVVLFLLHDFTLGQREHGAPVYVVNMDASHSTSNNPFCKDISRKGFLNLISGFILATRVMHSVTFQKKKTQLHVLSYLGVIPSWTCLVCLLNLPAFSSRRFCFLNLQVNKNTVNLGISENSSRFFSQPAESKLSRSPCWWDLKWKETAL